MNTHTPKYKQHAFEDVKASVNIKLAALWAAFMFLYIYVDYFALYMPGKIDGIVQRKIYVFDITPTFLLLALISVSIPALMIVLSVVLPAKVNRCTNIMVAVVYIPYTLFNLAGEAWIHMIWGAIVEVALLLVIIRYALQWTREL